MNPRTIFYIIIALFVLSALEIVYLPSFIWILMIFGAFSMFSSKGKRRQNRQDQRSQRRGYNQQQDNNYEREMQRQRDLERRRKEQQQRREAPRSKPKPKKNPFKVSGIKKFKDYEYEAAIEDFEKALTIDDKDLAVHFNLACAYSVTENKDKAFYHLDRAVAFGFKDFDKISEHDALAYIRIQDEFEPFVKNEYRLAQKSQEEPVVEDHSEVLEQLKKLAELKEKGLLTEEEFVVQKRKLLG